MRKKIVMFIFCVQNILCMLPENPMPIPRATQIKETFAGFPGQPPERFYYIREYPYTTLFVVTTLVSGILYYHRTYIRKRVGSLLRMLHEEAGETTKA